MLVRSGKNKGKKLQKEVQAFLLEKYKPYGLVEGDIENTIMGESGIDIKLSPAAKRLIPYNIECKNQEGFNRNSAIDQAEANTEKERIPLVIFRKNRFKPYAILREEHWLQRTAFIKIKYTITEIKKSKWNIWKEILDNKLDIYDPLHIIPFNVIRFWKDDIPYIIVKMNILFDI